MKMLVIITCSDGMELSRDPEDGYVLRRVIGLLNGEWLFGKIVQRR